MATTSATGLDIIKLSQFVHSRVAEMTSLREAVQTKKSGKRAFQSLPRSMRRRAMSYNVKRVPRYLREVHKLETEAVNKSSSKRPSRRYRRRPKVLLEAYNRRKRNHVWLETHIWHAKRFHMTERWGYRLPLVSTEKGARANYRGVTKHCLLQDISYFNCIQLCGYRQMLVDSLNRLTKNNLGVGSKSCLSGQYEGSVILYSLDSGRAIGPVQYMWDALSYERDEKRNFWIWTHPSITSQIIDELRCVFNIGEKPNQIEMDSNEMHPPKRRKLDAKDDDTSKENNSAEILTAATSLPISEQVTLTNLKDKLVRFHLCGPKSTVVLKAILQWAELQTKNETDLKEVFSRVEGKHKKFKVNLEENFMANLLDDEKFQDNLQLQKKAWETICSESENVHVPNRSILGLIVRDPRLFLPPSKTHPESCLQKINSTSVTIPSMSAYSPLWEETVRDAVAINKLPDFILNEVRGELNLVPGSVLNLGTREPKIPVLLVHHAGNTNNYFGPCGYGEGWDLILQAGWAMPFWISLIYNGARACGLADASWIHMEQAKHFFPDDYPDTTAAENQQEKLKQEKIEAYFRHPPAKRINYSSLRIVAPFHSPWLVLMKEWYEDLSPIEHSVAVLRDLNQLRQLSQLFTKQSNEDEAKKNLTDLCQRPALISVHLQVLHRGCVEANDVLCLPTPEDVEEFSMNKQYQGPVEAVLKLNDKKQKKEAMQQRKSMRKARRRFRTKLKKLNSKGASKDDVQNIECKISETVSPSETLPDVTTVVNSCSRKVIGYVTSGGYAFSHGMSIGNGCIVLSCFTDLMKNFRQYSKLLALVRSTKSLQYRFVQLFVHTDV